MQGPRAAMVVGGGLAGAAVAASLARRHWRVQVLDAAPGPAAGASGLPAGLLAPHTSADDNLLSQLSRAGVRIALRQARDRLVDGVDWQPSGVLQKRKGTPDGVLHEDAAWIRPAALVRSWLADPGVQWRGGLEVARLVPQAGQWAALDGSGKAFATAPLVVVAAALGSHPLLPAAVQLQAVRGQVSLGRVEGVPLASRPLNGNGYFLPAVPLAGGMSWLCGSSYVRGDRSLVPREEEHAANLQRLRELAPEAARRLAPAFSAGDVQAWTGIRCASRDRRPLLGEVAPGLWVSTAMGSRGLTFAALCAELLAARLHGEPLPLPHKLAAALDVSRQARLPTPGPAIP